MYNSIECKNSVVYGHGVFPAGEYEILSPVRVKEDIKAYGLYYIPIHGGPNDIAQTRGLYIHGGGSGLADPLALYQGFYPTEGCFRVQNFDLLWLVLDVYKTIKNGGKIYLTVVR